MRITHFVCSIVLSISLLAATTFAGEAAPSPTAPPPAVTTVKKVHAQKVEKNIATLGVFDLLSIMLSNMGIL